MALPLKELLKLQPIIERIQEGRFDENDVDNMLMRLRAYAGPRKIFVELANYVAHNDARDRGLAHGRITAFSDSMTFFRNYSAKQRPLVLEGPFPLYVYRLLKSQTELVDEAELQRKYRVSKSSLLKKIESNFVLDKKAGTCSVRSKKAGAELLGALSLVLGFISAVPAFHIREFHDELKDLLHSHRVRFDEALWEAQADRMTLALLCLVSYTEFKLPEGGSASCSLASESSFRVPFRTPDGQVQFSPESFGKLQVRAHVVVVSEGEAPVRVGFTLIETDLEAAEHCHRSLLRVEQSGPDGNQHPMEVLDLEGLFRLDKQFLLVRGDDGPIESTTPAPEGV